MAGVPAVAEKAEPVHSQLWGRQGELWSPASRLPDFSYAGYHSGQCALPSPSADVSVKDFGAVGDGTTDDTRAFQKAIAEAAGKTIAVPAGTYVITDFLEIRSSGTVLKGAGSSRSILRFPTPLNEIKPNWGATTSGQRTSNYSRSGGFISVAGSLPRASLARVNAPAKRGAQSLQVSELDSFKVGDEFRLSMSDNDEQSLAQYLYAGDPGPIENLDSRAAVSFVARITEIDALLQSPAVRSPLADRRSLAVAADHPPGTRECGRGGGRETWL